MDSLPRLFGLIPAAGSGSRMGQSLPKQYLQLAGASLLAHAVQALLADTRIHKLQVVVSPQDNRAAQLSLPARCTVAAVGGATRAQSVRNGLAQLSTHENADDQDWVLVHDAARPCLQAGELARLIDQVQGDAVGGLLALPLADTLKRASTPTSLATSTAVRASGTVDRQFLWRALTPQMFRLGVLKRALAQADLASVTDEASAIEQLGLEPLLVIGEATNIKVTTPADLSLAQLILQHRSPTAARERT